MVAVLAAVSLLQSVSPIVTIGSRGQGRTVDVDLTDHYALPRP